MMEEHLYYDHLDCEATHLITYTDRAPPHYPSFQIVFKLSCYFSISRWTLRTHRLETSFVAEEPGPFTRTMVRMSLQDLYVHDKAYAIINNHVTNWPVAGPDMNDFINLTLHNGREAVKSMGAGHNYVFIDMLMNACLYQVFHQTPMDVFGMIPADESSIEALETVVVLEESGSCTVCLEDFSEGCECVAMPCHHVFHPDCIRKWLRVSHFCPCCRFQMPTI